MKKILIFLLIVAVLGGLVWYFFLQNTDPVPGPDQMVVQGQSEKVVIHDVYVAPSPEEKPVVLSPSRDVLLSDTSQHQMLYFAEGQVFLIVLTSPDLETARQASEQALLESLQIDQATACKLKVSTTVPFSVDEEASGQDYGLSFCPNGKPFPSLP